MSIFAVICNNRNVCDDPVLYIFIYLYIYIFEYIITASRKRFILHYDGPLAKLKGNDRKIIS